MHLSAFNVLGASLSCCNAVHPGGPVNTRPSPPMLYSAPRPPASEMMRYSTPPSMASSNAVQPPGQPPTAGPTSTPLPPHFQAQVGAPPSPTLGSSSRVSHVLACNVCTYLIIHRLPVKDVCVLSTLASRVLCASLLHSQSVGIRSANDLAMSRAVRCLTTVGGPVETRMEVKGIWSFWCLWLQ